MIVLTSPCSSAHKNNERGKLHVLCFAEHADNAFLYSLFCVFASELAQRAERERADRKIYELLNSSTAMGRHTTFRGV